MTALEILLTGALLLALALLVIAHHGDHDLAARFRRERARRIKAERDWQREAIDNLELRDENAELRRALALHVGHPSVSLRPLAPVINFPQRGGVS